MKQVTLASVLLLTAAISWPGVASADLRVPQVALSNGNLQSQINSLDGGINVSTAQEDLQRWKMNVSGWGTLTLSVELGGNPMRNAIGIYNAVHDSGIPVGSLFQIFPEAAEAGWYAVVQFKKPENTLDVMLFDGTNTLQGMPAHYDNVAVEDFAFYMQNGETISFGQDVLNPGNEARALVFAGTGNNNAGWFLCFEDGTTPMDMDENQDFDEAILFIEAMRPVPVSKSSWASLKARFR